MWRQAGRDLLAAVAGVVLYGSLLVYCAERLMSSPAAGSDEWTNGTTAGAVGGLLAGVAWTRRIYRHRGEGIMPWQWFTAVLLVIAVIAPHLHTGPRGTPAPPMTGFENFALTAYAVVALVCAAVVGVLLVTGAAAGRPRRPAAAQTSFHPTPGRKHKRRRRR